MNECLQRWVIVCNKNNFLMIVEKFQWITKANNLEWRWFSQRQLTNWLRRGEKGGISWAQNFMIDFDLGLKCAVKSKKNSRHALWWLTAFDINTEANFIKFFFAFPRLTRRAAGELDSSRHARRDWAGILARERRLFAGLHCCERFERF